VFVDGQRVCGRAPLRHGAVIRIGATLLVFGSGPRDAARPLSTLDGAALEPSLAMEKVRAEVRALAAHDASFAVIGERGLRRTELARRVHDESGARGAFVIESSPPHDGTLHLRDPAEAEVRAALDACAAAGARLSVAAQQPIASLHASAYVPPLRERREDILAYADRFLGPETGVAGLCLDAAEALLLDALPGNIVELEDRVARGAAAAAAAGRGLIERRHLDL
jgi:transcriptional regulator of acetoin/glycerol metabolism